MSTLENVRLPLEEFTEFDDDAIDLVARTKLYLVGLMSAVHRSPAELSGGMQKRAAIAARWRWIRRSCSSTSRRRTGSDHIGRLDRLILRLARTLGDHFRRRHPRAAQHFRDRRPRDHARYAHARIIATGTRRSCAITATIRGCTGSSTRAREAMP